MAVTIPTSGQTIPEDEEQRHYTDKVADGEMGTQTVVNKKMIFGALGLFVLLLVILHFID
jgi:hypothetical protein